MWLAVWKYSPYSRPSPIINTVKRYAESGTMVANADEMSIPVQKTRQMIKFHGET
jgi:hypothetical protein